MEKLNKEFYKINTMLLDKIQKLETQEERRLKRNKMHKLLKQEREILTTIKNFWRKSQKNKETAYQQSINEMY